VRHTDRLAARAAERIVISVGSGELRRRRHAQPGSRDLAPMRSPWCARLPADRATIAAGILDAAASPSSALRVVQRDRSDVRRLLHGTSRAAAHGHDLALWIWDVLARAGQ
jgi:hypothetical protein